MLPTRNQPKQELVQGWEILDHNSAALKNKMQNGTASTLTIQSSVKL
jgi:hypothetical protein